MADFSTCTSNVCKVETPGIVDKCPACGSRVVTSRRIRIMGWLSIACGLFLVCFMGYITLAMLPTLSNAGMQVDGGRWNGTAEQARMVLNLFYTVIGFGVLATFAGIWQVVTGRRHIVIIFATLAVAAAIVIQTWQSTESLKQSQEAEEPSHVVQPLPSLTPDNLGAAAPDKPSQQ